ncbi:Uncharacterized protein TCM_014538 [Theobroma cacao]|uniref:Uncharacterized protein n=1 Tax=Theobroma cacao TaxID=3641 RepID=A0A061FZ52_THECC|nr:Uncharacterized protein TCM_014538 [Theobroma cacao]
MDMKSEGKLSFDAHLSSQIKDICKCVDNKEELKSEIKSLKYEIEKLRGLLEYDKNNQKLKEKEKQQEYECHDPELPIEPVTTVAKPRQIFFTPNVDRNLARLSYQLSHFPGEQ